MAEDNSMSKICHVCGNRKLLSDFHVLRRAADGRQTKCKACACAATRDWASRNKEKVSAAKRDYFQKNKSTSVEKNAQWQRDNAELVSQYGRKYRAANAEKERERARRYRKNHGEQALAYRRIYREKNRDLLNLWDANRRAKEKRATPSWANQFFIAEAYHLAKLRRQVCGGDWHVDHIVPLQGDTVCGLHVEHNLRVIPGTENMRKSNRYWPDKP